jgi:uncharacterized tellurite resistance protein B-like protein
MTSDEKKVFLLLKTVIFHYHGLDEDEEQILQETAQEMDALEELHWANEFMAEDYYEAFDRARAWLANMMADIDKSKRLEFMTAVWSSNNKKGYISEMEATAMIKIAQDWNVENEFIEMIKKGF